MQGATKAELKYSQALGQTALRPGSTRPLASLRRSPSPVPGLGLSVTIPFARAKGFALARTRHGCALRAGCPQASEVFNVFLLSCSLGDTPPVPPTLKAACYPTSPVRQACMCQGQNGRAHL